MTLAGISTPNATTHAPLSHSDTALRRRASSSRAEALQLRRRRRRRWCGPHPRPRDGHRRARCRRRRGGPRREQRDRLARATGAAAAGDAEPRDGRRARRLEDRAGGRADGRSLGLGLDRRATRLRLVCSQPPFGDADAHGAVAGQLGALEHVDEGAGPHGARVLGRQARAAPQDRRRLADEPVRAGREAV
eukprot:3563595-Prymnesium_polylepis.1